MKASLVLTPVISSLNSTLVLMKDKQASLMKDKQALWKEGKEVEIILKHHSLKASRNLATNHVYQFSIKLH